VTEASKHAVIRAKLKYPTVESFVTGYAQNVSKYGIFFKTPQPREVGTPVKFELKLADDTVVLLGLGEVAWNRTLDEGSKPAGMGIKFLKLDATSKETIRKILVHKKQDDVLGPSRYSEAPPPAATEPVLETTAVTPDAHEVDAHRVRRHRHADVSLSDVDSMLENIAAGTLKKRHKKAHGESADPPAEDRSAEEARRKAEQEARQKAEQEARRKAEQEARQKADEEARQKADEEARQKVEQEARQKADEEDIIQARARAAEQKRKAEQKAARIEADQEEIDDVIAAFDAIQMPGDEPPPPRAVSAAPPVPREDLPALHRPEHRSSSTSIADLISSEIGDGGLTETLEPDGVEPLSVPPLSIAPLSIAPLSIAPLSSAEANEDEDATGIITTPSPHSDSGEFDVASLDDDDAIVLDDDDELDDSAIIGDHIEDSDMDFDDSGFLDAKDYIIAESTDEMDIEVSTAVPRHMVEELIGDDDVFEPEPLDDDDETVSASDRIGTLIEDLSKDDALPRPTWSESLLEDGSVGPALDDIFDGEASRTEHSVSEREQHLARVSHAPETLPDDALPADLARLVAQRRSLPPPSLPPPVMPPRFVAPPTMDDTNEDLTGPGDLPGGGKKKGLFGKIFGK
jgi:uncharacterized protein (TIGR02266 family)